MRRSPYALPAEERERPWTVAVTRYRNGLAALEEVLAAARARAELERNEVELDARIADASARLEHAVRERLPRERLSP